MAMPAIPSTPSTISPRSRETILSLIVGAVGLACVTLGLLRLGPAIKADRAYGLLQRQGDMSGVPQVADLARMLEARAQFDSEAALKRAVLVSRSALAGDASVGDITTAEEASMLALKLSPLEPRAWALRALLMAIHGDKLAQSIAALGNAYLSSNTLPAYASLRAWTGIIVWRNLPEDLQGRVVRDIRQLWSRNDTRTAVMRFLRIPGADAVLQEAFTGNPDAIRELNRARAGMNAGRGR